ncbi:MAG: Gfo/Idh/MocA family oxidoreductase [Candidatus Poribacteria bacterium]|nr:Gfo/Idh/MocA family oxidoreductase [Candidatus Poribacteria bacterium]|tara:strand:- start:10 stop:1017 length:1008 start_codon:yes stop_codon:yes gene_type:complete
MGDFGIGLVGAGGMGKSLVLEANQIEGVKVVFVSDLDEDRARSLAEEVNASYTLDYHGLLCDDRIHAVFVASPPFLHATISIDAMNSGKHVFCEKPMATTLKDCDAMIKTAEQNQVNLGVGLVCRFHATHSKVREIVVSEQLGKPISMHVHRIGGPWQGGSYHTDWRMQREKCGGFLMEVNAHEIDFMRWTCGEIKKVYAAGGTYIQHEADYADLVVASLNFENGAVGLLHSGQVSAIGGYGGRVDCEKGSIFFPQIWGGDSKIQIKRFDGSGEDIPISSIEVESPVRAEIRAFIDATIDGVTPPVAGADGRAATEIALAAYRSIETGDPVNLPM